MEHIFTKAYMETLQASSFVSDDKLHTEFFINAVQKRVLLFTHINCFSNMTTSELGVCCNPSSLIITHCFNFINKQLVLESVITYL